MALCVRVSSCTFAQRHQGVLTTDNVSGKSKWIWHVREHKGFDHTMVHFHVEIKCTCPVRMFVWHLMEARQCCPCHNVRTLLKFSPTQATSAQAPAPNFTSPTSVPPGASQLKASHEGGGFKAVEKSHASRERRRSTRWSWVRCAYFVAEIRDPALRRSSTQAGAGTSALPEQCTPISTMACDAPRCCLISASHNASFKHLAQYTNANRVCVWMFAREAM